MSYSSSASCPYKCSFSCWIFLFLLCYQIAISSTQYVTYSDDHLVDLNEEWTDLTDSTTDSTSQIPDPKPKPKPKLNNRPIFGVLTLFYGNEKDAQHSRQYIPASYVKLLQAGGARVAPVFSGYPRKYYETLMSKINGILMPGGATPLTGSVYGETVNMILDIAIQMNERGNHFPVHGTCLSFQKILSYFLNDSKWRQTCNAFNLLTNLDLTEQVIRNPNETQMFQYMDESPAILKILGSHQIAAHYHIYCLTLDQWKEKNVLPETFRLISTNTFNNMTFVSTIEHRKYPIFGTAWHPEKPANEFKRIKIMDKGTSHDRYAILVAQYFANLLVNEARKNGNHFDGEKDEENHLIYNYNQYRLFTQKDVAGNYYYFDETFVFPSYCNYGFDGSISSSHCLHYSYSLLAVIFSFTLFFY